MSTTYEELSRRVRANAHDVDPDQAEKMYRRVHVSVALSAVAASGEFPLWVCPAHFEDGALLKSVKVLSNAAIAAAGGAKHDFVVENYEADGTAVGDAATGSTNVTGGLVANAPLDVPVGTVALATVEPGGALHLELTKTGTVATANFLVQLELEVL